MPPTDTATVQAFVGLGANIGDARAHVERALAELDAIEETRVEARSSLYRSDPWGPVAQPPFVNAVARLATSLSPRVLLGHLWAIERAHGRVRGGERWGPRELDLDLLVHGDARLVEPDLVLPHPRIAERAFVLVPLHEVEPGLVIPGVGRVADCLTRVDACSCRRIDEA